jgi:hypothetical protein
MFVAPFRCPLEPGLSCLSAANLGRAFGRGRFPSECERSCAGAIVQWEDGGGLC